MKHSTKTVASQILHSTIDLRKRYLFAFNVAILMGITVTFVLGVQAVSSLNSAFALTKPVSLKMEAEDFYRINGKVLHDDNTASNNGYLAMYSNNEGVIWVAPSNFKFATYNISVSAKENAYKGNAKLRLMRNGKAVTTIEITSDKFQTYSFGNVAVNADDRYKITFVNDLYRGTPTTDRNAYLDYVELTNNSKATPIPGDTTSPLPVITPKPTSQTTVTPTPTPKVSVIVTPVPTKTPTPVITKLPTPVITKTPTSLPTIIVTPQPTNPTPVVNTTGIKLPPSGKLIWDYQIGAGDGASISLPNGANLIDVDGFTTSATRVAQLKAQGAYTLCYIDAGSYEPGRPDSASYPSYLKLQQDPNWPAEYFLDVTDVFKPNSILATILRNRFQMCKDKGFDALDPDNLQNDENVSGGKITTQQQIDFNGWVADEAHKIGLAAFQKNGPDKILLKDRTGLMMVEKFDGIVNEECQQFGECSSLNEYVNRGKPALNIEYIINPDCTLSDQLNINTIRRDLGLSAPNNPAYKRVACQ